jgi:hypothetical protein
LKEKVNIYSFLAYDLEFKLAIVVCSSALLNITSPQVSGF